MMSYNPLIGLARNAKLRRMEMQCDPQWVLDLAEERDRLREDRDSHQRVCMAELEKNAELEREVQKLKDSADANFTLAMEATDKMLDMERALKKTVKEINKARSSAPHHKLTPLHLDRAVRAAEGGLIRHATLREEAE